MESSLKPLEASASVLLEIAKSIFDIILAVGTLSGIIQDMEQDNLLKEVSASIKLLKDDIAEVKGMLEDLNTTWSDIYDKTIGQYASRIEEIKSELKFLDGYISDLKRDFEDAPFLDLSRLKERQEALRKELTDLLVAPLTSINKQAVEAVEGNISALKESLSELDAALEKTLIIETADALRALSEVKAHVEGIETEKEFSLDISSAARALAGINAAVDSLESTKSIHLDALQAVAEALRVKAAIDAIPDITYKTVIVRYQTLASPLMPFTEGIRHIKAMMESLPTEGAYTLRVGGAPTTSGGTSIRGYPGSEVRQSISFAPTINIHSRGGDGRGLASELDRELARMWRYNRSELRRAMDA